MFLYALLAFQQLNDTGGAEGDRTPDLVIANDALSQLSYDPTAAYLDRGRRSVKRRRTGAGGP